MLMCACLCARHAVLIAE